MISKYFFNTSSKILRHRFDIPNFRFSTSQSVPAATTTSNETLITDTTTLSAPGIFDSVIPKKITDSSLST